MDRFLLEVLFPDDKTRKGGWGTPSPSKQTHHYTLDWSACLLNDRFQNLLDRINAQFFSTVQSRQGVYRHGT